MWVMAMNVVLHIPQSARTGASPLGAFLGRSYSSVDDCLFLTLAIELVYNCVQECVCGGVGSQVLPKNTVIIRVEETH